MDPREAQGLHQRAVPEAGLGTGAGVTRTHPRSREGTWHIQSLTERVAQGPGPGW